MHVLQVRRLVLVIGSAALAAFGAAPGLSQEIVELRVNGRYYSEPATIRVTIAVEPDAENRTLVIQADGERLFRSSHVPLEGENGRRLHTMEFKNLPAGHYVLRAEVRSTDDIRGVAEEMLVVGDPGELQ